MDVLRRKAWSPYVVGAGIGVLSWFAFAEAGHGHGSPCGADIGDRLVSTIGYERISNPFLQIEDRGAFVEHALARISVRSPP